jgi:hypothetical protein
MKSIKEAKPDGNRGFASLKIIDEDISMGKTGTFFDVSFILYYLFHKG